MSQDKKKAEEMADKRTKAAVKDKVGNEVIKTTERKEYTVKKNFGRCKVGDKIKIHPITAVSLVEKGLIEE